MYHAYNDVDCANRLIREFLNEQFTKIGNDSYGITAAIAGYFLSDKVANNLFNGILYPSIGMMANAENFVLTKSATDRKLKISSAKWYRVNAVDRSNMEDTITPLEYADTFKDNGEIVWSNVSDIEKKFL